MYRNLSNANLMEELEGRQMAVATKSMPKNYKNFYMAQINGLKRELIRRWRAQAVARNAPHRRVRAATVIQRKFKQSRAKSSSLNRNALKIAQLNYNARHNEGQGRLVEARNMTINLRTQYGKEAANNAIRRARKSVRR